MLDPSIPQSHNRPRSQALCNALTMEERCNILEAMLPHAAIAWRRALNTLPHFNAIWRNNLWRYIRQGLMKDAILMIDIGSQLEKAKNLL